MITYLDIGLAFGVYCVGYLAFDFRRYCKAIDAAQRQRRRMTR